MGTQPLTRRVTRLGPGILGRLRQQRGGGEAGLRHAQAAADQIGGTFGHQPAGGELAAGEGGKIVQTLLLVVEQGEAARDRPAVRTRRAQQRAHAGISADKARARQRRQHGCRLGDDQIGLGGRGANIVQRVDLHGCRADDGDGAARHHDVAIAGPAQAIHNAVGKPCVRDQQRSLGISHRDRRARQQRHLARPGASRIDHLRGFNSQLRPARQRLHPNRANASPRALKADHARAP